MSGSRKVRELDRIVEAMLYLQTEGRRLAREQCARLGVTATQLNVLKLLDEVGELSLTQLGRRIAAQNSTVTGIVDRMVQAGLVERERSESDRRVTLIRATAQGRRIARSLDEGPWELLRRALAALAAPEKATLSALLGKVAAHVEREAIAREASARAGKDPSREDKPR